MGEGFRGAANTEELRGRGSKGDKIQKELVPIETHSSLKGAWLRDKLRGGQGAWLRG